MPFSEASRKVNPDRMPQGMLVFVAVEVWEQPRTSKIPSEISGIMTIFSFCSRVFPSSASPCALRQPANDNHHSELDGIDSECLKALFPIEQEARRPEEYFNTFTEGRGLSNMSRVRLLSA